MTDDTTHDTPQDTSTTQSADAPSTTGDRVSLPLLEDANEKGYLGVATDERDNADHTVEGSVRRQAEGPPDVREAAKPS